MAARKQWWKSKTLWVNILSGIAVMIPQVRDAVPPSHQPYYVAALTLVNVALRAVTGKPIG